MAKPHYNMIACAENAAVLLKAKPINVKMFSGTEKQ